jgi:predicted SAM-dependent methyltransferase
LAIHDLLKFGGKRPEPSNAGGAGTTAPKGSDAIVPSKALPKFIGALAARESPVLVDFGPVIGSNVAFFGEQLGCKLFIEDVAADIDRHTRAGTRDLLPEALSKRFPKGDSTIDGLLCWDIFDFLDRAAAQVLAREVVRVLRPGGAVMGFFCNAPVERAAFTKFEIVDQTTLRHRPHPGIGGPKFVLQNRDILRMFDGLLVSDSFLLKSNTREILLRKRG